MRIKKWNARLSLLAVFAILFHTGYQTFAYITFYYNPILSAVSGYTLAGVIVLHAILSVISVFALHDSKTTAYKKLNIKTVLQRISAAVMLLLLPLHIFSFVLLQGSAGSMGYYLIEACQILFYASLYCHVAMSFTNALITLGWLEDIKKKRIIDRILLGVCTVMFLITSLTITSTHLKIFG
ncbi:MAG: hypothetical protein IJV39_03030 [Ruminococcus sp.]|nr:hypothetical protein [Ruminococcus sp.]